MGVRREERNRRSRSFEGAYENPSKRFGIGEASIDREHEEETCKRMGHAGGRIHSVQRLGIYFGARVRVEHMQIELCPHTGEQITIARYRGRDASVGRAESCFAQWLSAVNVPAAQTQLAGTDDQNFRIRGDFRGEGVWSSEPDADAEWFTGEKIEARFVLHKNVATVRAETQVSETALHRRGKTCHAERIALLLPCFQFLRGETSEMRAKFRNKSAYGWAAEQNEQEQLRSSQESDAQFYFPDCL